MNGQRPYIKSTNRRTRDKTGIHRAFFPSGYQTDRIGTRSQLTATKYARYQAIRGGDQPVCTDQLTLQLGYLCKKPGHFHITAYSERVGIRYRHDAASRFRSALAHALIHAGADAPTLCRDWTTTDLAAHLYVRENAPWAIPGLLHLPGVAGRVSTAITHHAMKTAVGHYGYQGLVDIFRAGPRQWSLLRIPALDAAVNTVEYFVHLHDIIDTGIDVNAEKALTGPLPFSLRNALWFRLPFFARVILRHAQVGIQLERLDTSRPRRIIGKAGLPIVTARGDVDQLVLWLFGRNSHIELIGDDAPVAAVSSLITAGV